ncbi:aldehyde dehydrogenase (NADP(+)) [Pseudomonas prosekii]|uniref:aldehyde dehydrogenase (NADP(+)) n=1 Tax=Pseudomonas prosekii TaxID=1148509 RepID=UPI0016568832|nr:aldehyde dehydrogenase (NADP(+)) [Pseudomonas prosekii]
MSIHHGMNHIGGLRSGKGEVSLQSYDASTAETLPFIFYQATTAEVDEAAREAEAAFQIYRSTSPARRAEFLDAISTELEELGDDFIQLVVRETALPSTRIQGERSRTINQLKLFAQVLRRGDFMGARIDTALAERKPLPRPDLRQVRMGIGPVAVFGASNFPLAFSTAGGDTASALAAGCPVVFKAHSGHMATAEFVASAIDRAVTKTGMPAGVFNMIYGAKVGEDLVKHPAIQAVGFTGSLRGGRALCDMAAARPQPIPVFAEMSSINPVVLLPNALNTRGAGVARELATSVVMGCGQFCTKPGLVIGISSPEFHAFIQQLVNHLRGEPAQTMLNAGTLKNYESSLQKLSAHADIKKLAGEVQAGRQAQPQLFQADVSLLLQGASILQEEIFGPTTVIVEAADAQQLLDALKGLQGQLTATLIADEADVVEYASVVPVLEQKAGRLLLNGYPTGVEVSDAMVHGGPYPATSDARGTSVGTLAIDRFLRPICYQNYPNALLPDALKNENPLEISRLINGVFSRDSV